MLDSINGTPFDTSDASWCVVMDGAVGRGSHERVPVTWFDSIHETPVDASDASWSVVMDGSRSGEGPPPLVCFPLQALALVGARRQG